MSVEITLDARIGRGRQLARAGTPGQPAHFRAPLDFVAHYLWRRRAHFLGFLVLIVGAAACAVAVQYGMKLLVDAMASSGRNVEVAWGALGLFVTLIAVESALWRTGGWLGSRTIVASGVDIRLDLFGHLSGHAMRYFSDNFSGSLGHRITATAGNFGALVSTFVWGVLPPCIDFLGALVVFSLVDARMAGALALFVVVVAGGLGVYGARGRPLHQAYAERSNEVGGELVDAVGNMWAVKAFSARERERARLAEKFGAEALAQRRSWVYLEKTRVLHDLALCLMAGGMLAWSITLWGRGQITPGDVVVVSALTFRILHGSRDLAQSLIGSTQNWAFIADILREIGRPHDVTDQPHAGTFVGRGGAIAFENVTFGYPDGRRVLENLTLRIEPGERVGIVGPSGAGKSTLVGLVQRLNDVQGGRILIDGQPLTSVTQDSLRATIAVVPQEILLFHRSILENIRYGREGASPEAVMAAAHAAQCDDFIRDLPQGYDTLVGERGVKLSGGQRQRIGIARAILKDAPVIILDEATSSLDSESEAQVQRALAVLERGRTVIAVAHRLSTLVSYDRIVVMVGGRVVEDGTPADLRRRNGVFAALWRLQAEGLDVDDAMETLAS